MAQKINPVSFRLGIQKDWKSRWFTQKKFKEFLEEDFILRKYIIGKLDKASLESVEIVRSANQVGLVIKSSRPGLIIGRGGRGLEELQQGLKNELNKHYRKKNQKHGYSIKIDIEEIKKPELYAQLVARNVTEQLERRLPFRRVMKQTIEKVMGEPMVKGIKIMAKGRLGGAEIARREHLSKGKIPLQNLRADIDYAQVEANTAYGVIGVKVWIYKGDVFADAQSEK